MPERWINRLTVFAPQKELRKFLRSHWRKSLNGRFWEPHENMRTRIGWGFETELSPIASVEGLSRRWPKVGLIFSFENRTKRRMGLAKAKAGSLRQFEVRY